jgi:hypothetical protein
MKFEEVIQMTVTQDFEKWANGFSGCDGGNLHAKVWFCGIEWGGEQGHPLERELGLSVSEPPQLYQTPGDILQWPHYGVRLMKLIAAIRGRSIADYEQIAYATPFPFHRDSDYFKLNLYPVAYRNLQGRRWPAHYCALTGIPTVEAYLQWCREHRFPRIRSWVERGQPKLIVGVGKGHRDDFLRAFGSSKPIQEECVEGFRFLRTEADAGKSCLAIIPFLGHQRGCLNSDKGIQAVGQRLGVLLNADDGS